MKFIILALIALILLSGCTQTAIEEQQQEETTTEPIIQESYMFEFQKEKKTQQEIEKEIDQKISQLGKNNAFEIADAWNLPLTEVSRDASPRRFTMDIPGWNGRYKAQITFFTDEQGDLIAPWVYVDKVNI